MATTRVSVEIADFQICGETSRKIYIASIQIAEHKVAEDAEYNHSVDVCKIR